jgi:Protein of unknown function (DUF2891)
VQRRTTIAFCLALGVTGLAVSGARTQAAPTPPPLDAPAAERFAALALACLHREYPTKISHVLESAADVRPARDLTPAFYGCYDWHSAVHGHWLLVRLIRAMPDAQFAGRARAALAQSLTPAHIAVEVEYLRDAGRRSFERPYGLAWLLRLCAELRQWRDPDAQRWLTALTPLEAAARDRLVEWLPKLPAPIRVGEHDQTGFSFGLIWDWAQIVHDQELLKLLRAKGLAFYSADRACPLSYEPSGEDFLSPCLGEADFMRRLLEPQVYAHWLSDFLPQMPRTPTGAWLKPVVPTDRSDPKLAHFDGLNLSRAWMLNGIADGLPPRDPRRAALATAASAHGAAALPAVTGEHYEGGHWLATFAVYLLTEADRPDGWH